MPVWILLTLHISSSAPPPQGSTAGPQPRMCPRPRVLAHLPSWAVSLVLPVGVFTPLLKWFLDASLPCSSESHIRTRTQAMSAPLAPSRCPTVPAYKSKLQCRQASLPFQWLFNCIGINTAYSGHEGSCRFMRAGRNHNLNPRSLVVRVILLGKSWSSQPALVVANSSTGTSTSRLIVYFETQELSRLLFCG